MDIKKYHFFSTTLGIINIIVTLALGFLMFIVGPLIIVLPIVIFIGGLSLALQRDTQTNKIFAAGIVLNSLSIIFGIIGIILFYFFIISVFSHGVVGF